MDQRLLNACRSGDYDAWRALIEQDESMLDGVTAVTLETPLHLVFRHGHVEMAKEILNLRPLMAFPENYQGLSPMHIAVAYRQPRIVEAFLCSDTQFLFFQRDRDGRNPVHHMAMRGYEDMLFAVLQSCPELAESLTDRHENILDLCLKYHHKEMKIKLIEEFGVVRDQRDDHGNTVLSLETAASRPEEKVTGRGYTDTKEKLLHKRLNTVMLVATLIAACTFQALMNPPGNQEVDNFEDSWDDWQHHAFMLCDTIGLMTSLLIILLIMCVKPDRLKLLMRVQFFIMWISVFFMAHAAFFSLVLSKYSSFRDEMFVLAVMVFTAMNAVAIIILFVNFTRKMWSKGGRVMRIMVVFLWALVYLPLSTILYLNFVFVPIAHKMIDFKCAFCSKPWTYVLIFVLIANIGVVMLVWFAYFIFCSVGNRMRKAPSITPNNEKYGSSDVESGGHLHPT
ncbi:uncharacterized protein LOC18426729 [Amborella trichopoda]|uniref:PGG domain-containing protein n=1 Tax=Amborella trichopoda TaxID=13333 RepID=W1NS45_AMBTC|nr:uncharacterized protein LOC18426729 [Amborella trichopoda]ERM98712.1 hypothetical protein AMTR_s00109p00148000 [Amborella trichopoda]|eukprot:XP_006833434.1 uncharacterized protein LOC18426729 [Amborella trichopoda]